MVDDGGYFVYQPRTDDTIIGARYNSAGPEVEGALLLHPAVAECGVIGTQTQAKRNAMQILQPPTWMKPRGYSNGVAATGRIVFVAGQVGWNASGEFETNDFVAQARQALANIVAVLAEAGGRPEDIARLTWYVVDKGEYLASSRPLGRAYREVLAGHYPAMTAIQVAALVEAGAKVEIEATAVIPERT